MISKKMMELPDDVLAKYIEGTASDAENRLVAECIHSEADLWLLQRIALSI